MAQILSHTKPDLPILAPRPLKQSLGSPLMPRRPLAIYPTSQQDVFTIEEDRKSASSSKILTVPSPRFPPSESFEDKPEIRELYLAAEEELKEIVEGFTHTYVHNLLREDNNRNGSRRKNPWMDDEEEEDVEGFDRMDEEYFSPFGGKASLVDSDDAGVFPMEDLPRLGGSPSPLPEYQHLSSDIRNYGFFDEDYHSQYDDTGFWQQDVSDEDEEADLYYYDDNVYEEGDLPEGGRWMTDTPPVRPSNPVCENLLFGRRTVVVTTSKPVVLPPSSQGGASERMSEWRQRRKRIMSEPPQKGGAFASSIECF